MQVVIYLPGLVSNPQVVRGSAGYLQEDHEVRQHDLVHLPKSIEAVQVVLRGRLLPMCGLARQQFAHRMNDFTVLLQDASDRLLRQPLDLQVWHKAAEFTGDCQVALDMTETNWTGDVQCARSLAAHRSTPGSLFRFREVQEFGDLQIDLDR